MGGPTTRLTARQGRSHTDEGSPPDAVHRLAERLARELRRLEAGDTSDTTRSSEVLLDIHLDGLRITVLHERPVELEGRKVALSPREYEIARMVAKGYPNKTIASVLEISTWTVSTHLRRVFAKLNVTSRAAMVARLLETGIIAGNAPETKGAH